MSGQPRTTAYITLLVGGNESYPAAQRGLTKSRWWRTAPGPADRPTDRQGLLNDRLKRSFWVQPDTTEQLGIRKSVLASQSVG